MKKKFILGLSKLRIYKLLNFNIISLFIQQVEQEKNLAIMQYAIEIIKFVKHYSLNKSEQNEHAQRMAAWPRQSPVTILEDFVCPDDHTNGVIVGLQHLKKPLQNRSIYLHEEEDVFLLKNNINSKKQLESSNRSEVLNI